MLVSTCARVQRSSGVQLVCILHSKPSSHLWVYQTVCLMLLGCLN